jgi:hypothetical protein
VKDAENLVGRNPSYALEHPQSSPYGIEPLVPSSSNTDADLGFVQRAEKGQLTNPKP